MNVIIDGIRYVPAEQVRPTKRDILVALMKLYWGEFDSKDDEWINEHAEGLCVVISDKVYRDNTTIVDFVDQLGI